MTNSAQNQKLKVKGKNGGARKGAGRKPGLLTKMKRLALAEMQSEAEKSMSKLIWLRDHADTQGVQMACAIEIKNTVWGKPVQAIRPVNAAGEDAPMGIIYEPVAKPAPGQGHKGL